MRSSARLLVALVVVPAVAVAIVVAMPWSNATALVVGWMITAVGCGAIVWPRLGVRTLGWPLVLASVVYFAIAVTYFAAVVGSVHDAS